MPSGVFGSSYVVGVGTADQCADCISRVYSVLFPVMILIRVLVGLDGTACIGIVELIT